MKWPIPAVGKMSLPSGRWLQLWLIFMTTLPVYKGVGVGVERMFTPAKSGCYCIRWQQDAEVVAWRAVEVCVCISSSGECDSRDQRQMKRLMPWGQVTYGSARDSEPRGHMSQIWGVNIRVSAIVFVCVCSCESGMSWLVHQFMSRRKKTGRERGINFTLVYITSSRCLKLHKARSSLWHSGVVWHVTVLRDKVL